MAGESNIIRVTESICHECFQPLEARIIEKENKVFFEKNCPVHGKLQILLSEHPWYYRQNSQFFFNVMNKDLPQDSYHLYLTDQCNLSCQICITESGHNALMGDFSIKDIEEIIKNNKKARLLLFGGEPTCFNNLPEVIKVMKERGSYVMMCTNGIKLADFDYLKQLAHLGLDRIDLQFDGFKSEVYKIIRNADLLKIKLKALENLKAINLPTGISMLLVKGLNDDQINPVLDYAVKNNFIKNVSFLALTYMGGARNYPLEGYTLPDQIVDLVEDKTKGKISRNNMLIYQKVFNAYSSFIRKRRCFYYQSYVLIRKNYSYVPIDEILNFRIMNYELDKYAYYVKKNKFLAGYYLFKGLVKVAFFSSFKPFGLKLILEIMQTVIYYALPMGNYNKNSLLLNIIFTTACDPYKMDKAIREYCHRGIFYAEEGRINRKDFRFDYNIDLERDKALK